MLHAGGQIVIMREFDPGAALDLIDDAELGLTHLFAVPAPYQFMMQHPKFATTDLSPASRWPASAAHPAPRRSCAPGSIEGVVMAQGWGMTETSPGGSLLAPEDALRKIGSAGKAVLHTEIKIVDDDGNELPHGSVGELADQGPQHHPRLLEQAGSDR